MLSAIPGTQWKWSCLLAAGIILIAFTCYGQGDHGLISGVVRDPSVAVVPHATVSATNASTGLVVKAESNQQGVYTVGPLPAGVYAVAVNILDSSGSTKSALRFAWATISASTFHSRSARVPSG